MKTFALSLLAASASAGIIKRQGHSHGDGPAYGAPAKPAAAVAPAAGGFQIPGFEGFKNPLANFAAPKDGYASVLSPKIRNAHKVEFVKPVFYPDARRVKITYGPYKVRASSDKVNPGNSFSMDPQGTSYNDLAGPDFPRDVLIVDADSYLVNETFKPAIVDDGIYNHHTMFTDVNKRPPTWLSCNGWTIPEAPGTVFMGSGSDENINRYNQNSTNSVKSGFYVGKSDVVIFGLDVVNYHDRERTLWMQNEIEYFPGIPDGYVDAQNRVVPLGMCDGFMNLLQATSLQPPTDKKVFTLEGKNSIDIVADGHIVATNGHLHDGGLGMDITINGTQVCSTKLLYGGPGHEQVQANGEVWKTIAKNVGCDEPIRVSKGDHMQLHAHFDFEKHPPRHSASGQEQEGMALVLTTFVPLLKK